MSVSDLSPIVNFKNDGDHFINYSLESALSSKLSNLSLDSKILTMSTPAAASSPAHSNNLPAGLKYKKIDKKDRMRVLDFLKERFFHDEPLNFEIKLLQNKNDRCQELEEFCLDAIDGGYSTMIVDSKDKIIAVGLFGLSRRSDVFDDFSEGCQHPRFKKILQLLYKISKESAIFTKLPDVDVVLEVKIISVDNSYRGQGLAHHLLYQAKEIAKSNGVNVLRCDCTSAFSAKVMEKLGSTKIYGLKYKDYKVDGKIIFNPKAPHDEVTVYYHKF